MADSGPAGWIDDVTIDEAMANTAEIARWVRLSGTEDERTAFDFIDGKLRAYGLKTWFHEPTCLVSLPVSGALAVGGDAPITAITHSFSISTPKDGIAGQLVYAGQVTEDDFHAANVRGKIALTEGLATPGKAHAATNAGALAVVSISGTPVHEMIVSPVWGSPTPATMSLIPNVAMLSIDNEHGDAIRKRLNDGEQLRVRVFAEVDTGWRPIPLLVADLDTEDREYVLFSGHVDSWHYGAMDNGSANATMMETARVLAAHRSELRRGVRFAFWSGHSHARYAGSTWFADKYWFDLRDECVAHVNVDSTGAVGATDLTGANTMAETYAFARDVIGRQTGQKLEYRRFGRAGDQSFWGIGLPALFMSLSQQGKTDAMSSEQAFLLGGRGGGLGWWWHTTEDTLDKINPEHLERDIKVYVEIVGRLATDAVLPFDVGAVLAEIDGHLNEIESLWSGLTVGVDDDPGFDALRGDLAVAVSAAEVFQQSVEAWSGNEQEGMLLSSSALAACKALMPVNYTLAGQFDHDPALNAPPLPSLRPFKPVVAMSDDEQWAAGHGLRREINKARSAVREAARVLRGGV
ncbi:MAG TPA: M28 family peptidase [Thermomicrobiales bacterium]|nr:M28 family peptidase [Thermomicrobiales bacterium]